MSEETQIKIDDFKGELEKALDKFGMRNMITKAGIADMIEEAEYYAVKIGRSAEDHYQYIFEHVIPDGERDEYLTVKRIDGGFSFLSEFLKNGDCIEAIAEKGNFEYLKSAYDEYKRNNTSDDKYYIYYPEDSSKIPWAAIQKAALEHAKFQHKGKNKEFFDFDNRSGITPELAKSNDVFYRLSTPQLKERLALESSLHEGPEVSPINPAIEAITKQREAQGLPPVPRTTKQESAGQSQQQPTLKKSFKI